MSLFFNLFKGYKKVNRKVGLFVTVKCRELYKREVALDRRATVFYELE